MSDYVDWGRHARRMDGIVADDDDDDDDEHGNYHSTRSFFKYMVRIAGIPPFDTKDIPREAWNTVFQVNRDQGLLAVVVAAMIYCIHETHPYLALPQDSLDKHGSYESALRYLYEAALRQGFGARAARGDLLEDDLGM